MAGKLPLSLLLRRFNPSLLKVQWFLLVENLPLVARRAKWGPQFIKGLYHHTMYSFKCQVSNLINSQQATDN
jgi:hypothetical protein